MSSKQTKRLFLSGIVLLSFVWITAVSVIAVTLKLNEEGTAVSEYQISPDEKWVVFTSESFELFSAPVGGGGNIPLTDKALPNYTISPDSSYVIFQWDHVLYTVPIAGGTPAALATNVKIL